MSVIETFWNQRKEEITDLYNGTVFVLSLFDHSYDDEGRYLIDNSRHVKPIKLFRLKKNDTDSIVVDFTQSNDKTFWGCILCDYVDTNQKINYHNIETNDQCYSYFCNGCTKMIINGFHCEKCDFDLCKVCYESNITHQHKLVLVNKYLHLTEYQYENCSEEFVANI